jgi:hypothetical protein
MIGALLTIAICLAVGWPLSLLLDRSARLALRIATAFLLGSATAGGVLLLLSMLKVEWSRTTLLVSLGGLLAAAGSGVILSRRKAAKDPDIESRDGRRRGTPGHARKMWALRSDSTAGSFAALRGLRMTPEWAARTLDAFTALLAAGYALFATVGPTVEYDFIGIWGVKAKEFGFARGIDWHFLEHPFNEFAHVDYPILLPLIFDAQTLIRGSWDDRWLGALNVAFGVAALLAVRAFLEEETDNRLIVAAGTLALMSSAFSPWIGLAEGPLVACGTVGLLYVRRGVLASVPADVLRGALFLGLAGSFKNEGLALILAAAAGLLLSRPRFLLRLWPAIAIVTPWIVLRRVHHLQTDLTTGPILTRITDHLANLQPMFTALATYTLGRRFFWIGVAVAIAIALRRAVTRERFLLVTLVVQVAFFLAAYIVTPHDVTWHVRWSWERIVNQITLPLGFAAIALLASRFGEAGPRAEG